MVGVPPYMFLLGAMFQQAESQGPGPASPPSPTSPADHQIPVNFHKFSNPQKNSQGLAAKGEALRIYL